MADHKKCRACGEDKPLTCYWADANNKDGTRAVCSSCASDRQRRERLERKEEWRLRHSKYRAARLEHFRDKAKRYYLDHRLESSVRMRCSHAIRSGKMARGSCEVCGVPNADAHHDDYSKPFSVRWLCRSHHIEWHHHNRPISIQPLKEVE
jgi:hypothetical protein